MDTTKTISSSSPSSGSAIAVTPKSTCESNKSAPPAQNLSLEEAEIAREDLEQLAGICTCKRSTKTLPSGGVEAPGDHTSNCVSVIASHALAALRKVKTLDTVRLDKLEILQPTTSICFRNFREGEWRTRWTANNGESFLTLRDMLDSLPPVHKKTSLASE